MKKFFALLNNNTGVLALIGLIIPILLVLFSDQLRELFVVDSYLYNIISYLISVGDKYIELVVIILFYFIIKYLRKPNIKIISAKYYTTYANEIDVTEALKSQIKNGKILCLVSNHRMGKDPHEGVQKKLTVTYKNKFGKETTKELFEGDILDIP